jgi:hypothetical protein
MSDPGKVLVAVTFFVTVAYSIGTLARAWVARGKAAKLSGDSASTPVADERFARLEQAVDAIALEVERISEGQRFTTRLLSEQARRSPRPENLQLSPNTPT